MFERLGDKKPFMFIFQMQGQATSTISKKMFAEQFRRRVDAIQRAYSTNRYVVIGVITFVSSTSGYSNIEDLKEYIVSSKNLIMLTTSEIPTYAPGYAHRFLDIDGLDSLAEQKL